MNINKIRKQKNYNDTVLEDMISEIESNLPKLMGNVVGVVQAPTGVGKTHSSIRKITPLCYEKLGTRFVLYIAPQKSLIGRSSLSRHIKNLKKKYLVTEMYSTEKGNVTIGEIESSLLSREDDEIVLVTMSDSFFNNNVEFVDKLISSHQLEMKTLILLDEAHYGMVSDKEFYKDQLGSENPDYNAVKFNNVISILDKSIILGLSATPIKEQIDISFGTDKYLPLNTYPSKEKLSLRVSGYLKTIFYPQKKLGMEKTLRKFFKTVINHQAKLDSFVKNHNLPEECEVQVCGGIKIETPYKNKQKDDKYQLKNILNSNLSIPKKWNWDLCLDTSDGISVWRFENGEVIELSKDERKKCGYVDSDMLVNHMRNKDSRLRFMVVVNKGSMGLDIHNWNFGLGLRIPGTKDKNGTPVILGGTQWWGRFPRVTKPIETFSKYFNNCEDFKVYNSLVNSYQHMLPESPYWRKVDNESKLRLPSMEDINSFFDK